LVNSLLILFSKTRSFPGKSVATGAASVGCKGVLKQFGIDTEKSYSTRITEYDKSDTALYLKIGAAK
jgi:hypothetical protein